MLDGAKSPSFIYDRKIFIAYLRFYNLCIRVELNELLHKICFSFIMPIPEYFDRGPVRVTSNIDLNNLVDKSVIVTGGNISQALETKWKRDV